MSKVEAFLTNCRIADGRLVDIGIAGGKIATVGAVARPELNAARYDLFKLNAGPQVGRSGGQCTASIPLTGTPTAPGRLIASRCRASSSRLASR